MPTKKRTTDIDLLRARQGHLLAGNPNHFGNLVDSKLKAVQKIVASTSYEELASVGYNPRLRTAYATFDVKKDTGYGGDLCTGNGAEYVRFYARQGGGWTDLGVAGTDVHDVPAVKDCRNRSTHPLTYAVQVRYDPQRRWCLWPQLHTVRAILSYGIVPPPNQPNWVPVWGNVKECPVQIDKTTLLADLFASDEVIAQIDKELLATIVPHLPVPPQPDPELVELGVPLPEPGPGPVPLTLAQRLETYSAASGRAKFAVDPARIALPELHALSATAAFSLVDQASVSSVLGKWDLDIGDLIGILEDTTGNIDYEELVDVGLDYRRRRVDATYVLKRGSGYSGGLCSAGSTEYVTFWTDWDDTCRWTLLGTVAVKAYDFGTLPDGRLCYTASLPVDLTEVMAHCSEPKVGKVRAVLSWDTPPSTTDADAVPYYGNRLDAHVLVPPRTLPSARLAIIGGVPATLISDADGLTVPGAVFDGSMNPVDALGRPCPFGRGIRLQGVGPEGTRYRVRVVGPSGTQTLTSSFWITNSVGVPTLNTASADGWFTYKDPADNVSDTLANYSSTGDDLVDIVLEIEGVGDVDHQLVQLDNTAPTVAIDLTTPGNCEVAEATTTIEGVVSTHDLYPGGWSVVIDGGPTGFGPYTIATGTTNASGVTWSTAASVDPFPAELDPCGYVARLEVNDRAIVNNGAGHNHDETDIGFSVV